MAEKPTDSFVSDYIKKQRDIYAQQFAAQKQQPVVNVGESPLKPAEPEVGPLGKVIDFLSRPLYAVTNVADKTLDLASAFDRAEQLSATGQNDAAVQETLKGFGAVAAAPFTGFFSTKREDKNYFSDIIEKASDVSNRKDPTYKDTPNNVDPRVKGVVGFAGDVALDPLTWVPAAWIAKGVQLGSRGLKAAAGGTKSALENVSKTAKTTRAAQEAQAAAKATEEAVNTAAPSALVEDVVKPAQAAKRATDIIADAVNNKKLPKEVATASALRSVIDDAKIMRRGRNVFLANQVSKELKKLIELRVDEVGVPVPGRVLSGTEWPLEATTVAQNSKAFDDVSLPVGVDKVGKTKLKTGTLGEFLRVADKNAEKLSDAELAQVTDTLETFYTQYLRSAEANPNVNLLGEPPKTVNAQTSAATGVARLMYLSDQAEENLRAVLGTPLLNNIRSMNADELAEFVDKAQNAMSKNGIVENLGNVKQHTAEWNLLKRFNISIDDYRTAVDDLAERINQLRAGTAPLSTKAAIETLETDPSLIRELTEDLSVNGNESLNMTALDAIKIALRKTLYRNFDESYLAKKYKFSREEGELLLTSEEYGQGVARLKNMFGTFVQNDLWTSLSMRGQRLFGGIPVRDSAGRIVRDANDNIVYRVVPTFMRNTRKGKQAYFGFDLAQELENFTLATARSAEDFLSGQGIPILLDFKLSGAQRQVAHLRYTDIYRLLDVGYDAVARSTGANRVWQNRWLKLLFFNTAETAVPRTHIADAIMRMRQMTAAGMDDVAIREELLLAVRSNKNRTGTQTIDNWLSNPNTNRVFGFIPEGGRLPAIPGVSYTEKYFKNQLKGHYVEWNAGVAAEHLVDALMSMRKNIDEVIDLRTQKFTAKALAEHTTIAPEIARQLINWFQSPTEAAAAIKAVNNIESVVDDYIRGIQGTQLASVFTKGAVSGVIPTSVKGATRSAEEVANAAAVGDATAARAKAVKRDQKLDQQIKDEGREAADKVLTNPDRYSPETVEAAQQIRDFDISNPFDYPDGYTQIQITRERIVSAFQATYRMDEQNKLSARLGMLSVGVRLRRFTDGLKLQINDKILRNPAYNGVVGEGRTILQEATRLVQNRTPLETITDPVMRSAVRDLYEQIGKSFSTTGEFFKTILSTSFIRAGGNLNELNKLMYKHAVLGIRAGDKTPNLPEGGEFFDLNLAAKDAPGFMDEARKALPNGSEAEIAEAAKVMAALDQWRTWDIKNVGHFLVASQSALYELGTKVGFLDNMFANAERLNLATTNAVAAKAQGFVKIVSEQTSYFGDLLPPNMYMAPEVAQTLQAVDIGMRTSRTLSGGFGEFVNTVLDPLLTKWKSLVTIYRVGHHIRNFIGGHSLRYFALGTSKYTEAWTATHRLLASRKNYTDVDMWASLRGDNLTAFKDGDIIVSGKKFKLNAADAFADVNDNLFDVGRISEDLLTDEIMQSGVSRGVDVAGTIISLGAAKPGGFIERAALTASEFVEHEARASHYLQAMMQMADGKPITTGIGKVVYPKNIKEARQLALESALKSHPNAASVGAFESKYMRRLFPFYSWFKPAMVALAEASVMHPARTLTTIPKASYNLAIAMGIDPYSMYYPFPTDQMFPSFLTEEGTGPQFDIAGRYIAVNPGFANLDIYNTFAGGPIEGAVQMVNPYARIPLELLAGSRLGTQAPIRDFSDYLDSSIPFINYASNISGLSITGGLQPQEQVTRGVKTGFDQALSAFNWLTGFGARNYSRPNYINYAEIEERNRAAEELNQSQSFIDKLLGG